MDTQHTIGIGLISHTNIGKTSLARTLLRQDVGEIKDEAHVTLETTGYPFISDQHMSVTIWDTPGFGGTVPTKLVKRLQNQGSPVQWLLRQTIDRFTDKATFSSVDAARTLAQRCDAALYLVSAKEDASAAAYVQGELDLIALLKIPVIIIINQVESDKPVHRAELIEHWQSAYGNHPAVHDVVVFDAHSRLWFEEIAVLRSLGSILPDEQKKRFLKLVEDHRLNQLKLEQQAAKNICSIVQFARNQSLKRSVQPDGTKALKQLLKELQGELSNFVTQLCQDYNLTIGESPALQADLAHLQGVAGKGLDEKKTGLLAGALSGASYGLAADAMAGGLSFGGGALVGFVLGGLGGIFAAKGINALLSGGEEYNWKPEFLDQLMHNLLMIFLLIAHHGRGKGGIDFKATLPHWETAIKAEMELVRHRLMAEFSAGSESSCRDLLNSLLPGIFRRLFPDVSLR